MADGLEIDVAEMKKRLLARKAELEHLMEAGAEARRPDDLDQQRIGRLSRIDAMQVQAMAEETARRREVELHRIDAALARIEDDEYGYCTSCGEQIAVKRLENDPATPLCIECAGKAEG